MKHKLHLDHNRAARQRQSGHLHGQRHIRQPAGDCNSGSCSRFDPPIRHQPDKGCSRSPRHQAPETEYLLRIILYFPLLLYLVYHRGKAPSLPKVAGYFTDSEVSNLRRFLCQRFLSSKATIRPKRPRPGFGLLAGPFEDTVPHVSIVVFVGLVPDRPFFGGRSC